MENGQKKLNELFAGHRIFNIPDYQRAYAWNINRQLPDFIEDIQNQSLGKNYFLGTILFRENGLKKAGFDLIDIVDGQQRITTVIIFMKSLLERFQQDLTEKQFCEYGLDLLEETYIQNKKRPKLEAIAPDNDFFQNYILGNIDGKSFIQTPSQRRLYEAKQYFKTCICHMDLDALIEIKTKLDEFSNVLTYSVQDASDAALIFETTNDRGKGLTNLEKIKSFLMYKSYQASEKGNESGLDLIQQRFAEIYRDVESFDGRLEEDTVLQYHFIAFEKWKDKEGYQRPLQHLRNILNPMISAGEKEKAIEFIDRFSRELRESFNTMRELVQNTSSEYRDLASLDRIGNFNPLLMKTFKLDSTASKEKFKRVARLLEIFSFRVFSIMQRRSNTGQAPLYTIARDFQGKFDPLNDKISEFIEFYGPKKKFIEYLKYPDLYDWISSRDLNYLFWKYENHLRATEQPICPNMSESELFDKSNKKKMTVEHIAAQNPKELGILKNYSILPRMTDEFLEGYLHSIGNLTFDPASANASKGNQGIQIKNLKYFTKAPYKTQNELEFFINNGEWNVSSIEKRAKKIIKFCSRNWHPDYLDE